MGRLEVCHRVLVSPSGIRRPLLKQDRAVHRPVDRLLEPRNTERLVALEEEVAGLRNHIVVESDERAVVSPALERMVEHQRIPLRPAAHRILAVKHELDGLVERGAEDRIILLDIYAEQELSAVGGGGVIEGGVAVIVLELLKSPAAFAYRGVPVLEGSLTGEIETVVPAAALELSPDEC